MEIVKVNKDRLAQTLAANRDYHKAEYQEAMDGWYAMVAEWIEEMSGKVSSRALDTGKLGERYDRNTISCPHQRPVSHQDDYETALEMLEWETEVEVTLTQEQFKNLIQDNWDWTSSFKTSHSTYSAAASH